VRRRWLCAAFIICLAGTELAHAADARPPARPDWCRPGYACISVKEIAADTEYKARLERDLRRAQQERLRRFGFTFGPYVGVGPDRVDGASVDVGIGVTWGVRF